jgi:hypothetical protein
MPPPRRKKAEKKLKKREETKRRKREKKEKKKRPRRQSCHVRKDEKRVIRVLCPLEMYQAKRRKNAKNGAVLREEHAPNFSLWILMMV